MKEKEEETKKSDATTTGDAFEAVILAGGLGTRLSATVQGLPKVLAPVAGRPFLSYLIDYLRMQGIRRFVFSLGYGAGAVQQFLKERYPVLDYSTAEEEEALGTGGAIRLALQKVRGENVFIVNGDTLFKLDIGSLLQKHLSSSAECTLALKKIHGADRFGLVEMDKKNTILSFTEKKVAETGLINGGVYILNKSRFFGRSFPLKFSFEKDYLEKHVNERVFAGSIEDGYFIDIGIPADYEKAKQELAKPQLNLKSIDRSWTLFIDRDGVINEETIGEYVLHWEQFVFSKGVLQSFKKLSDAFGRLLLVTNQKGVGRGLMTKSALDTIHYEMQREIALTGGHLDKIYFCSDVDNNSFFRKPNPGMALQAKNDFPEIDFTKCLMVGNKMSDMRFGKAAGMFTVFLATTNPEEPFPHPDIDLRFNSLAEFAAAIPSLTGEEQADLS